jgi:hypothetical protein
MSRDEGNFLDIDALGMVDSEFRNRDSDKEINRKRMRMYHPWVKS